MRHLPEVENTIAGNDGTAAGVPGTQDQNIRPGRVR